MQPTIDRLVIATHNQPKYKTICGLLHLYGVQIPLLSLAEVGVTAEVEETGTTIEENGLLKAQSYAALTGQVCLSDDSSLEIDALNGEPGIHAKYYAGPNATDEQKRQLVLEKLAGIPQEQRAAHFRSALVIAWPDGHHVHAIGTMSGWISFKAHGKNIAQYPYCSLFVPNNDDRTIAQIFENEDFIPSDHRRLAVQELVKKVIFPQSKT